MIDHDTPTTDAPKMDVAALTAKYIELRDLKAQMKAQADAAAAPVQEALEIIESALLKQMQETGTTALKTTAGTAFISERTSATVADWDAFLGFVRKNDLWNLLNHAANKTGVQEFAAQNNDLPPGVNWRVEKTVNVRRS